MFADAFVILNNSQVFVRTKNFDYLAGVLLALTGCEAMFARCVSLEIWTNIMD